MSILLPNYDQIGQRRVVLGAPQNIIQGDHPPVELAIAYVNTTWGSASVFMGAPGATLRYRIFVAKVMQYSGAAQGGGIWFPYPQQLVLTGYTSGGQVNPYWDTFTAPLTGFVGPANTAVMAGSITGAATPAVMLCIYIAEVAT